MLYRLLFLLFLFPCFVFSQQTKIYGRVTDAESGEALPFVKIQFVDTKIGVETDDEGMYSIETYYATDSIFVIYPGYIVQILPVKVDKEQEINIALTTRTSEIEEFVVRPPDELPSVTLHKKIIRHKPINDRAKLLAYEYELYNKIQFDLNNIGEKFKEMGLVKNMALILDYLDSTDQGKNYLPMIFTESLTDYYYTKEPKRKKEVVKASRTVGLDKLEFDQFLGEMYMDINIYHNNIPMTNKSFISPLSSSARNHYQFLIVDSAYIDDMWCYKMTFRPKREGSMTFQGEMWIHDTTYAVKSIQANISPWANINYMQDLYFEQHFDMVAPEVWMMTNEVIIADFKLTKKTDVYGLYARKHSYRKDFKINQIYSDDFYKSNSIVEVLDSAKLRDAHYWETHRHVPLTFHQEGIVEMSDSLRKLPFFKFLQSSTHLIITGHYPAGKIEYGNVYNLISFNPVEKFRFGFSLRTSNDFSKRLELGGKIYYGIQDEAFKYGASVRYHLSEKKRNLLSVVYSDDIEQIGAAVQSSQVGSTFGTLLRTGPLDKLTFVKRFGAMIEKDVHKSFVVVLESELKDYTALGKADYKREETANIFTNISSVRTHEVGLKIQWAKEVDYIEAVFDRVPVKSRFPIVSLQTILGIKGSMGSEYAYQKYDLNVEQRFAAGRLGFIRYSVNIGYINGQVAYPFLKVHEGNQSYYSYRTAFNMLSFYEFISDKYISTSIENHWGGLFLDYIKLVKKLRWRFVTTAKLTYGDISSKHEQISKLPDFTKRFDHVPYVELSAGIENIFNLFRIDLCYRATHQIPNTIPLGLRVRWEIYL